MNRKCRRDPNTKRVGSCWGYEKKAFLTAKQQVKQGHLWRRRLRAVQMRTIIGGGNGVTNLGHLFQFAADQFSDAGALLSAQHIEIPSMIQPKRFEWAGDHSIQFCGRISGQPVQPVELPGQPEIGTKTERRKETLEPKIKPLNGQISEETKATRRSLAWAFRRERTPIEGGTVLAWEKRRGRVPPRSLQRRARPVPGICAELAAIEQLVPNMDQSRWFLCGLGSTFETSSIAQRPTFLNNIDTWSSDEPTELHQILDEFVRFWCMQVTQIRLELPINGRSSCFLQDSIVSPEQPIVPNSHEMVLNTANPVEVPYICLPNLKQLRTDNGDLGKYLTDDDSFDIVKWG
ncbi:hypothetical protein LXL04_022394 [Taraxacum kok-saghyz]